MSEITVRFRGDDVRPDSTPIEDIMKIAEPLQKAVNACAKDVNNKLCLTSLEDSCTFAKFTSSNPAAEAGQALVVNAILDNNGYDALPQEAVVALSECKKFIESSSVYTSVSIGGLNAGHVTETEFSKDKPMQLSVVSDYHQDVELHGTLTRVGGKEPTLHIYTYHHGTVVCDVDEKIASQLAECLYKKVRVSGRARIGGKTNKVARVLNVYDWNPVSMEKPSKIFAQLKEVVRDRFDDICDVDSYCRELREGSK